MFKNSAEIFAYIKKEDVKLVDVRFIDLPGIQHHFNVPVGSFDEAVFTDGLMFDGSSIRGFQAIHESDMKLLPVPESAFIDPFRKEKTLIINFSVHNPVDNSPYSRDPRGIVAKAVEYMQYRHCRHRVLRSRGRVLCLRCSALLNWNQRSFPSHRFI